MEKEAEDPGSCLNHSLLRSKQFTSLSSLFCDSLYSLEAIDEDHLVKISLNHEDALAECLQALQLLGRLTAYVDVRELDDNASYSLGAMTVMLTEMAQMCTHISAVHKCNKIIKKQKDRENNKTVHR